MSTRTLPPERTYKVRLDPQTIPSHLTQAEVFHHWETGRLHNGAQYWSDETSMWNQLAPAIETMRTAALAKGRTVDVALHNRRHGPFSPDEALERYGDQPEALYWRPGMNEWQPLNALRQPAPGAVIIQPSQPAPGTSAAGLQLVKPQKSYGIYVGLGLLLGFTGAHDFYAGYIGRALMWLIGSAVIALLAVAGLRGAEIATGFAIGATVIAGIVLFGELLSTDCDVDGDRFSGMAHGAVTNPQ